MKIIVEARGNCDCIIICRTLVDTIPQTTSESTSTAAETAVECEANQTTDENTLNYRQTAKFLGISVRFLTRFLVENGYAYRGADGNAYAFDKYVKRGLFQNFHYNSPTGHHGIQTRITKKGVAFIAKLLQAEKQK